MNVTGVCAVNIPVGMTEDRGGSACSLSARSAATPPFSISCATFQPSGPRVRRRSPGDWTDMGDFTGKVRDRDRGG